MINLENFTNKDEVTRQEFDTLVKGFDLEVYTQKDIHKYIEHTASLIEKGEDGELTPDEKSDIELAKSEIGNLKKYKVVDRVGNNLISTPLYVQERMVDIEKGTYSDNSFNRKLGRVGKQFGGKKKDIDPRSDVFKNKFKQGDKVTWKNELGEDHGVHTGKIDKEGRHNIKFDDGSEANLFGDVLSHRKEDNKSDDKKVAK